MKKVLALILALVLCVALVACDNSGKKEDKGNSKIVEYMEKNGDEFLEGIEEGFTVSGMTCRSSYEVVGNGLVVTIRINELEDLDQETKDAMQESFEDSKSDFDAALEMIQEEISEVEYLTLRVCEKDGDLLAEVKIGK